jgi:hypothetical protein
MSFHGRVRLVAHRQHGRLVDYTGDRARVVFGDDPLKAMAAAPFLAAKVAPGDWFVLVVHRHPGGELVTRGSGAPRILRVAPPRLSTPRNTTPAVYLREGRSVTTRR